MLLNVSSRFFHFAMVSESPPSSGMISHHDLLFHSFIGGHLGCVSERDIVLNVKIHHSSCNIVSQGILRADRLQEGRAG